MEKAVSAVMITKPGRAACSKIASSVAATAAGSSILGMVERIEGRLRATELKAMILDGRPIEEVRTQALKHMTDITGVYDANGQLTKTGDVANLEQGTDFGLWYVLEGTDAQRRVIIDALQTPRSMVNRVRFGAGDRIALW